MKRASARELLARARFPLFAIPPSSWDGAAFVGSFTTEGEGIRDIQFVYLDGIDEHSFGICVSNIDGSATVEEPLDAHLLSFSSRLDEAYVVARVKRRKGPVFAARDFTKQQTTVTVAGRTAGALVYIHREIPLRLARVPLHIGSSVTDIGVAGWRLDPLDHLSKLLIVDPKVAAEFDAEPEYEIQLDG
ncbi:MAG: hypothetical protein ABR552_03615 [Actinomycetota bacterium]